MDYKGCGWAIWLFFCYYIFKLKGKIIFLRRLNRLFRRQSIYGSQKIENKRFGTRVPRNKSEEHSATIGRV